MCDLYFFSSFVAQNFFMLKNTLNGLLIVFLMLSYLNRGLFVDMSEARFVSSNQISHTENEINSMLELIFALTGNGNEIDEDGNSPETYNSINFIQPLVYQDFARTLQNNLFSKDIKKNFCVFSDAIFSLSVYGQIDHPPEG